LSYELIAVHTQRETATVAAHVASTVTAPEQLHHRPATSERGLNCSGTRVLRPQVLGLALSSRC
jgi:hypothetical protein